MANPQTGATKVTCLTVLVRFSLYVMLGPAIAEVANCQASNVEVWVRSQASQYVICGGQSGSGIGFSLRTVFISCQCYSANALYILIHLCLSVSLHLWYQS
jgi:hypothetical protein